MNKEEAVSDEMLNNSKVHVVKNLNLSRIKFYGFDMDFTLCEYVTCEFDKTLFMLTKQSLVQDMNYSTTILDIPYNSDFSMCGLWCDKETGNILKVDFFGKILACWHGTRKMELEEVLAIYPSLKREKEKERIVIFETLYNVAEAYLIAALIDQEYNSEEFGHVIAGRRLSFRELVEDVHKALGNVLLPKSTDQMAPMQKAVVEDLPRFVKKDSRLPMLLRRIKENGGKPFLVTNSDWKYANIIMAYLLGTEWNTFFDLVLVNAQKPLFFSTGSDLKYVDTKTGSLVDRLSEEKPVFSGGDHITVARLLGARGPDVIYCGDHLYGDVVRCRKLCEWRTLLVVPILEEEQRIPMKRITGSLFREGKNLSFFASQMMIWSDIYTSSVSNLMNYSVEHKFTILNTLPHEGYNEESL